MLAAPSSASTFTGGPGFSLNGDHALYLNHIANQLNMVNVPTQTLVCEGPVAEAISSSASNGQDLIVMSTNGRSGLKRVMIGSVASGVVQTSSKPILLLKPNDGWRSRSTGFKRLLVALDGSEYSERVLPYVRLIAQKFYSEVTLLMVLEGTTSDKYQNQIRHYLEVVADELRGDGVQANTIDRGQRPGAHDTQHLPG